MRAGLSSIATAAAALATISLAVAAEDPARFDRPDAELGRSLAVVPSKVPQAPLAATDQSPPAVLRAGNPLWRIPINTLHATRERPLFSPSRRPPPPPAVAVAPPPPPPPPPVAAAPPPEPEQPGLSLVGVVTGHNEGFAIFVSTTDHNVVRLRTGEGQNGWILRSVSAREVVLEKNNRTAVVELPPLTGDLK